jgi:sugar transferase (PEP-CTERM/EpsH1 system associated)
MRVLHIMDSLGVGGTEMGVANIVEHTRDRIEHVLCCVRQGGTVADRLRAGGNEVIVVGKAAGNDWRLPFRLFRVCRRLAPDVVHTRNWGSIEGIVAARLARVPVVIHGEHGRDAADPDGMNGRRNRVRRLLAPLVNRVVTVSEQLRLWLTEQVRIPSRKVAVLRNGVDVDRFRLFPDRERLRAMHGFSATDLVVGTVGRLDAVKDQGALLHALEALSGSYPNVRMLIVGDGPEHRTLESQIAARGLDGRARMMGYRADVPEMLNLMDVFVLPSVGEGMCNTILEAMAVGLPVIATAVGGNPELVRHDVTGMLVPARDPAALAAAIARYTTDAAARRRHGDAGQHRVVHEFTLHAAVERYISLYEALVAASGTLARRRQGSLVKASKRCTAITDAGTDSTPVAQ